MARLTLLQTVNRVLRRLRESEVSTVNERTYSRLVTDLVNQAILEVENAYYWPDMRSSVTVSATSGTDTYPLSGWGERGRVDHLVNETMNRSMMTPAGDRYIELQTSGQTGVPNYWRITGYDGSGDPQIQFYPSPDGAYTITVYGFVGLGYSTGDSATLLVPSHPVILKAYAMAIQERGEDVGTLYAEAQAAAENALYEAIEREEDGIAGGQVPVWRVA